MKKIWISFDKWDKNLVLTAINGGIDALVVPKGFSKLVSKLGKILTICEDGDLVPDIDVKFLKIESADHLEEIIALSLKKIVVLECSNLEIISLENIVARKGKNIILSLENFEEFVTALNILDKGILGILLRVSNKSQLQKILLKLATFKTKLKLNSAIIESIRNVGLGDRVCIDTCTSMDYGEGMLIGNSSNFLYLIHAENVENTYIKKRSFRVNAGAIHAYTVNNKAQTNYLSEISSGDKIQVVNFEGDVQSAIVGRVKIEKRSLLLVKAIYNGYVGTIILQNAETIRLISPKGWYKSILDLKPGDEVLVHIGLGARHFGYKVEEYLSER